MIVLYCCLSNGIDADFVATCSIEHTHARTHTSIPFNVCCHLFHLFFILFDSVHICPHFTSEINGKGSSFIMVRFIGFPKCFNNKSHSQESMPSQIDIVLQWLLVLGCLHLQYFLLHCVSVLLAYSNTTHTQLYIVILYCFYLSCSISNKRLYSITLYITSLHNTLTHAFKSFRNFPLT